MASLDRKETAGLVVVGASLGGLVTAIAAADHGHRVVIVERSRDLGGGAGAVSENVAAAGTRFQRMAGITDDPDRLLADIVAATHHHVDNGLARALASHAAALVEWLADRCGAAITLQATTPSGGHTTPRLHAVGEQGGATLAAALTRAASHHSHIRIRSSTEVERLLVDEAGGVSGVALRGDRRGASAVAGSVVLACGGFAADDALVAEHGGEMASLPYLGPPGARGDALRLARSVGASVRHLSACAVVPLLAQPSHFAIPRAVIDHGAIVVNQRGQRFVDESAEALGLARAIRAQPGRIAYVLFDERIATAVGNTDPFFAHVVLPRTARRAASIAMIAKQLELGEQGLTLTLDSYHGNLDRGEDPFGRASKGPRLELPLYAIRVTGARTATRGGLATDTAGRVLGETGTPIAGLYAVGGAAASALATGGEEPLAGLDTLHALGLARLAALDLAPVPEE